MSYARIFAAVDSDNRLRFVGDVPGGRACGCFCSVCRSPLIARKGDVNVWHFAHEAGQEREECLVGAMNLLRRLAAEYLKSLPKLVLPTYQRELVKAYPHRTVRRTVTWDAQPVSIEWFDKYAQHAPIARVTLDKGAVADLFVEIGDIRPNLSYQSDVHVGALVFWSTVPVNSDLRNERHAQGHIRQKGALLWLYQPDSYGLVADEWTKMTEEALAEERAIDERTLLKRERFENMRSASPAYLPARAMTRNPVHPHRPAIDPVAVPVDVTLPSWARHRKAERSFFGYRYPTHGAWVLFELTDGRAGIRKLDGVAGWQESLGAWQSRYSPELDLLVVSTVADGQAMFPPKAEATRISTSFVDMLALLEPLPKG